MESSGAAGLRGNRNWRLLWLGQGVSIVGDFVFDITVVLWVATVVAKGKPWAPTAVVGVLIATALPALLVGPFAGVYVDRWDRRRTMLTADAARALLIAGLVAVPALGSRLSTAVQLGVLYAVVFAASCFAQFFNPSRFAILGLVVAPEDRAQASSRFQATSSFATIIGPPLGAPLLFALGAQWALVVNAVSFAVSFATIKAMRLPVETVAVRAQAARFFSEMRAGLRFFMGNRVLVTLTVGVIIATLGTGALNSLNVFFVSHNLHVTPNWLGTLSAGEGAGAIAGALVAARLAAKVGSGRVFWAGLVIAGVVLLGYSRTSVLAVAIVVMAFAGAAVGAVNTAVTPLLLAVTPQELIGRVASVIQPVQQLAAIGSMTVAGFLASTVLRGFHGTVGGLHFGTYDTIFAVAGLLFIAGGLAAVVPLRHAAASHE